MSTPVETPITALARRWRLEVDMGDEEPDWQLCPAITSFQWTAAPNIEDDSSYDTEGWNENTKTAQAWEVQATFNRKVNEESLVYSEVHEALRLAAFAYGSASRVKVRFFDRTGLPEAYSGTAIVTWEPQGGEHTALDQVQVTLTGTGRLEPIDNPAAPEPEEP